MSGRRASRRAGLAPVSVLALVLALGACANAPQVMRYDDGGSEGRLWPAPPTQEVPRYRYVGQLTGEGNFGPLDGARESGWQQAWRWLTGLGDRARQPVVLQRPQTGMVDAAGRVLVTDVSRGAVFVFDEAGGQLAVWDDAGGGQRFAAPVGIAAGPSGEVWVADAELGAVLRLDARGRPLGRVGVGLLQRPTGLARDAAQHRTFVADTQGHDIKVFDDTGRLIDRWGRRGDGEGELNFPTHLAWARDTLYVSDMVNARVQAFDALGQARPTPVGRRGLYVGNLVRPKGVAVDDEGHLYVVEGLHDHLLVFDAQARLLMALGGTGREVGQFFLPSGVWVDARNRVYVADMFNGRVVVFQFLGGG